MGSPKPSCECYGAKGRSLTPAQIKKFEVHRYSLKPRAGILRPRPGALLRATFTDLEHVGVSDLFPWSEFGDPSLETWFAELKTAFARGTADALSTTLRIAISAARDEAIAASKQESLVRGSIRNHWLATDPKDLAAYDVLEARRSGAPAIKIKIGRNDVREEAAALARLQSHWGLRLRLDANERLTRDELLIFLDALPIRIRDTIEFIEDPFEFDIQAWSQFHRDTEIDIAYDRAHLDRTPNALDEIFRSEAAQVLIHKPAWQDETRAVFAREQRRPVVVTSILGHPVGNLWAASRALELAPDGVHGCISHVAYRDDDASLALVKSKQVRGSRIVGAGVGVGLSAKWFGRLKWETLT